MSSTSKHPLKCVLAGRGRVRRARGPVGLASVVVAALVGSAGLAACGFDGAAGLESSASPTDPAGPGFDAPRDNAPSSSPSTTPDAGPGAGDSSTPVSTCSDTTLSFDGVNDVATVPDDSALDLSGDFTVEAWIKPAGKLTGGAEMDVVSHHDASNSQGWVLLLKNGRVEFAVYGSELLGSKSFSAGGNGPKYVTAGAWAHVAATLQGDTLRIYYGGMLRDTQQIGGTFFGRDNYQGALRLGRAASTEDLYFQGELDDVRLSKTARYTGATAPKPTGVLSLDDQTIAAWRFDEPGGNVLVDAAKHSHDGSIAPDSTAPARLASTCIANR